MIKYFFLIIFIILSINTCNAEDIYLNYTDSTDIYIFSSTQVQPDYNFTLDMDNNVYYITSNIRYGVYVVTNGVYYNNLSFNHDSSNYLISEKYDIDDYTLWWIFDNPIGKKVNYSLDIYKNNEIIQKEHNKYYIFKSSTTFSKTQYTFILNELQIINTYSSIESRKKEQYNYKFENEILINQFSINNIIIGSLNSVTYYIEYVKIGDKPKSYYIDQLHPLFKTPYNAIGKHFDKNNSFLNILLIVSYLLRGLFFWIKVIYLSLFTIIIIILIGVIPLYSFITSYNRQTFIHKLFSTYRYSFMLCIKIIKYITHLIIEMLKIISNLIPFT